MKKLLLIALLLFIPTLSFATWQVVDNDGNTIINANKTTGVLTTNRVYIKDALTYLDKDANGNLVCKDVNNASEKTLTDLLSGGSASWGSITGTLSSQTDLQNALNGKASSLGADDNYVTDAEKVVIGNTSGTNTGDASGHSALATLNAPAFTGTPTGIGIPVYAQVTGSNATTTGQSLVDVTGLSVALTTSATYDFEAVMSCSTTAVTTGTAYGVQYSVAGGAVEALITGSSTTTATKTLRITALNTATTLYLAGSAQTGGILIKGRITTGANAGNLTIQHLKLTSGTSTVFIGSFLKVIRIN